MNEFRLSACHGKDRLTWAVAKSLCNRKRKGTTPYRCGFCGHWHIGTKTRKTRKAWKMR